MFFSEWLFACFTALIPFIIGIVMSKHFKVTHWLYFVAGAAITAVALSPLYLSFPVLCVVQTEPSFQRKFFIALPFFIAPGSLAGFVCWRYLSRQFSSAKM